MSQTLIERFVLFLHSTSKVRTTDEPRPPVKSVVKSLRRDLGAAEPRTPMKSVRMTDLPADFRNADLLRVAYAEGLVEFGKQRNPLPGEYPQTRKWDFWSQTAGDWPLTESLTESSDNEFPWHVRLSVSGENKASRLRLETTPAAEDDPPGEHPPPKGTAGPVLSDRQYTVLQVLLEQNAFSPDKRCTRQVIAEKAEGKHATASTYGKHIANLVLIGFANSKGGPDGGIWLTEDGQKLAEQLKKNRQR